MRPRRQKGRGFQKCIHTSQIISIFNQSTQNFHIFSDAKKKVEDSRNAHIHLRLNQFSITAHNIFTYDPIPQKQGRRFRKCMYTLCHKSSFNPCCNVPGLFFLKTSYVREEICQCVPGSFYQSQIEVHEEPSSSNFSFITIFHRFFAMKLKD